jgi:hypothetical protein
MRNLLLIPTEMAQEFLYDKQVKRNNNETGKSEYHARRVREGPEGE